MENVYEIKKKKNLNYILPKRFQLDKIEGCFHQTVILIHIYYVEKISDYIKNIKNIPRTVDIIFTVSNNNVEKSLREQLGDFKNKYKVIYKENRGRDISALLVAAKEELMKYQYIGFIHDKKEKNESFKEDIDAWNYCLWENMLGSELYIKNVIFTLKEDCDLGILVPPIPTMRHLDYGYSNNWGTNFENVKNLAKKLFIKCDLSEDKPPIALGTVFWAKKAAIDKLFHYKWEYTDFNQEPLEDDGTLSHAIERIFPYVAQDAGFYTGWVMTDEFAARQIEDQYHIIVDVCDFLRKHNNIQYLYQIGNWISYEKKLLHFCKTYTELYIYGTGNSGMECFKYLQRIGIKTKGFIVTSQKYRNSGKFMGFNVWILDKFVSDLSTYQSGIILAVKDEDHEEIFNDILCMGIDNNKIFLWRNTWE